MATDLQDEVGDLVIEPRDEGPQKVLRGADWAIGPRPEGIWERLGRALMAAAPALQQTRVEVTREATHRATSVVVSWRVGGERRVWQMEISDAALENGEDWILADVVRRFRAAVGLGGQRL